jgi:hypothetical protein
MAKITVVGDAAVVTSTLTVEDINTLKKYRPEALVLMGGEDNKEPIFAVDVSERCGNIGEFGIVFSGATRDEEKKAMLTVMLKGITGDVKEYVADKFGAAMAHLNELEAKLPAVLEAVNAHKQQIMDSITIAQ